MREILSERPVLDVYICNVLRNSDVAVMPSERQQELDGVTDEKLKRQKLTTWTLLNTALKRSFGCDFDEARFARLDNGKWVCDKARFSLSHTDDYAVVAVSDKAVGVDAENKQSFADRWADESARNAFAKRIVAQGEACDGSNLLTLWIKKESAYKRDGRGSFKPSSINTDVIDYVVREYDGAAIAVCGDSLNAVRFFKVEGQAVNPIE